VRPTARAMLLASATAAAATLLTAGHAAAGGPTSVIVVNPATGEAGALYTTDADYQILVDALAPWPDGWVEQPPQLSAGPGTSAINITWLVHDVSVWRVDHIRLDLKYVWVQTNLTDAGMAPYPVDHEWHVAADAEAVTGVLDRLGVLPGKSLPEGGWAAGTANGADELTSDGPAEPPAATATSPDAGGWQWAALAPAGGFALGVGGRTAVAAIVRRRAQGSREELVDLERPGDGPQGSGQPDPHPAEATPFVLDLGDLYPADLPR
jgi:hypothetical protein